MLKLQNVSFENRVIVAIHSIYLILALFFGAWQGISGTWYWKWDVIAFWCSLPLINIILYWIISGYKKEKGTKFSFIAKLIIALLPLIIFFGLAIFSRL